jgi:hypothetical protein
MLVACIWLDKDSSNALPASSDTSEMFGCLFTEVGEKTT